MTVWQRRTDYFYNITACKMTELINDNKIREKPTKRVEDPFILWMQEHTPPFVMYRINRDEEGKRSDRSVPIVVEESSALLEKPSFAW